MASELTAAPVLSTPDDHLFEYAKPITTPVDARSEDELCEIYEIARTARDIRDGGRTRVALQFPDHMLGDAPKVVELLAEELHRTRTVEEEASGSSPRGRIYILADTSYSACCVDEIAAEHVDADVVVHYGRSCLSPTSRLQVIYVFTKHELDLDAAINSFQDEIPDKRSKAIIMADVTYQDQIPGLYSTLQERGYKELLSTRIEHNPLGSIPNRTIIGTRDQQVNLDETNGLQDYTIFHVSSPPTALLLALSSRVAALHILETHDASSASSASHHSSGRTTRAMLGRRYAKVLKLATAGIIGILVNTLSVANYLASIDALRAQIAAAGKKSYTVVVGRLNPAKLANFAEMDGWVVVGCWESSLVEEDAGFYAPVVTPFELGVALMPDEERVWGLGWWGGTEGVAARGEVDPVLQDKDAGGGVEADGPGNEASEDDSDAPVFDLRTGKLVYNSRPMRSVQRREGQNGTASEEKGKQSDALAIRTRSELATVNGVLSPGAEYLRSQRTWQGLGSDFNDERSATIEEGRSGVARGYTVGEDAEKT